MSVSKPTALALSTMIAACAGEPKSEDPHLSQGAVVASVGDTMRTLEAAGFRPIDCYALDAGDATKRRDEDRRRSVIWSSNPDAKPLEIETASDRFQERRARSKGVQCAEKTYDSGRSQQVELIIAYAPMAQSSTGWVTTVDLFSENNDPLQGGFGSSGTVIIDPTRYLTPGVLNEVACWAPAALNYPLPCGQDPQMEELIKGLGH